LSAFHVSTNPLVSLPLCDGVKDSAYFLEPRRLVGWGAGEGAGLLLEPLNRYEDNMLNRLDEGVELAKATKRGSIKIMGDLFHMNIEEDDLGESIRRTDGHLAHVHLADSNRAHPGAGHTDFAPVFDALREIGFDGYLAMECAVRGDARTVLPQVARSMWALMG
jgi:sugar phosphate isomerase/epimerase